MIKYRLICKSCNLTFDSWFSSSQEYEKLKKKKLINCHNCSSLKVEKTLMSPRVSNKNNYYTLKQDQKRLKEIKKTLHDYQKFIKDNFKYVGENFAYEARSIHYDKERKNKGIYGKATNDELKELKEEGIETQVIPWLEGKNN